MNSDTRYVFDTNVIISALLFNTSVPGQAFTRSLDYGTILISQSLVEELNNVLGRAKFNRYVTREERESFVESLIGESELVEITEAVQSSHPRNYWCCSTNRHPKGKLSIFSRKGVRLHAPSSRDHCSVNGPCEHAPYALLAVGLGRRARKYPRAGRYSTRRSSSAAN